MSGGFHSIELLRCENPLRPLAAASTPLGMLVSWPLISVIDPYRLGALVYVGATHLLPRAEQEHKRYSLIALASGVAVAVVIVLSKA